MKENLSALDSWIDKWSRTHSPSRCSSSNKTPNESGATAKFSFFSRLCCQFSKRFAVFFAARKYESGLSIKSYVTAWLARSLQHKTNSLRSRAPVFAGEESFINIWLRFFYQFEEARNNTFSIGHSTFHSKPARCALSAKRWQLNWLHWSLKLRLGCSAECREAPNVIDGINELNREVKCLSMNLRAQSDCEPFFLLLIQWRWQSEKVRRAVDFDA